MCGIASLSPNVQPSYSICTVMSALDLHSIRSSQLLKVFCRPVETPLIYWRHVTDLPYINYTEGRPLFGVKVIRMAGVPKPLQSLQYSVAKRLVSYGKSGCIYSVFVLFCV
jgi:hypothetical protein